MTLVAVAVLVIVEAIRRLSDPPDVDGTGVLVVGVIGLAGNVAATVALAGGDRADMNLEGVLRHSVADALGSLGVVVGRHRGRRPRAGSTPTASPAWPSAC